MPEISTIEQILEQISANFFGIFAQMLRWKM